MNLTNNPIATRMGLQFPWIEANLLGFFLVDVRNSRGKFEDIKEKFAINPAPIASQSSLNVGGSRWNRDLPRNSLNSFTNRSKVEEQRREIHAFKEGNWPEFVGHWSGRGGDLQGSWERFHLARAWLQFRGDFWTDLAVHQSQIGFKFGNDCTTIGPRSCVDRYPGARSAAVWSCGIDSATKAVRSRLDRTAIMGFFHNYSLSSDGDPAVRRVPRVSTMEGGRGDREPSDEDRPVWKHPHNSSDRKKSWPSTQCFRSRKNHVRPMKLDSTIKSRWKLDAPSGSTCHQIRRWSCSLNRDNSCTCLIYDREDSGPRNLGRLDGIRRSRYVHVTCKR